MSAASRPPCRQAANPRCQSRPSAPLTGCLRKAPQLSLLLLTQPRPSQHPILPGAAPRGRPATAGRVLSALYPATGAAAAGGTCGRAV
jgi:hypothetical protein